MKTYIITQSEVELNHQGPWNQIPKAPYRLQNLNLWKNLINCHIGGNSIRT